MLGFVNVSEKGCSKLYKMLHDPNINILQEVSYKWSFLLEEDTCISITNVKMAFNKNPKITKCAYSR